MSKVLPSAIHDRPELNLRQGIKSSLNHWRQLIATLYLFYRHINDGGNEVYAKEVKSSGRTGLEISDDFATWLDAKWSSIPNIKELVKQCPLFQAQMEHLQVGIELFLKLAKVEFVDTNLTDAVERTGGSRFAKKLHFSTNMKILAETVAVHPLNVIVQFITKWLSGMDAIPIGNQLKGILLPFTEECQYKIRTSTGEIFFQQDGVYAGLLKFGDTVESSDIHEPVGPFRILKSYIKEGMHPYLADGANGFFLNTSSSDFAVYADMVRTTLKLIPKRTTIYQEIQAQQKTSSLSTSDKSRQRITYGAPGTGKSWRIKNDTRGMNVIRTTFHPDSDYSTFVGAYKPSMESFPRTFMKGEEIARVANGDSNLLEEKRIVYRFVEQAFLEAYVAAWRNCSAYLAAKDETAANVATQFLVIEEINRGNCAQIFGDIFQLLDREDDGYSSYAIIADRDLRRFLCDSFQGDAANGMPMLDLSGVDLGDRNVTADEITSGTKLLLPPNLYIWATMNTSDQSLFPIDSAFKRRWEWTYMPICDAGKGWRIKVAENEAYDWWTFLEKANALVQNATDSEDKKLGYFFCKADASGNITLEQFVGKVVFYLWNDVFKDTGFEDDAFNDENGGRLQFKDFFDGDGSPIAAAVGKFMENLGVAKLPPPADDAETSGEGTEL